ncbi:MAG: hypothetical protein C3F15_17835 [Holophagae bacterium]|nr:MAG: hypothetical protein C3F15_17835 [Holophagae bacterium]
MSSNVNVTNPSKRKRVLIVAANPATSPTTGWPIGFWWAELTHPWWAFTEAGRVTALVCHATCVLLEARLATGALLVEGKTWTGFANSEEQLADSFVGTRIQPFWIEEEARQIEGTNFVVDQPFREFAVRDGLLVTGQQQFSGAAAARLVIEALGR